MQWHEILALVIAVGGILAAIAWADIYRKAGKVWSNLLKAKTEYEEAMKDGVITDEEKKQIADTFIAIIVDVADMWQALTNLALQIISIIKKARALNPSKKVPPS